MVFNRTRSGTSNPQLIRRRCISRNIHISLLVVILLVFIWKAILINKTIVKYEENSSNEEMNWQIQRQYFKLRTERINPQDFEMIINAPGMKCETNKTYLLIMCVSKYTNSKHRLVIRNTWGSVATRRRWPNINGTIDDVQLVFLLGRSSRHVDNSDVLEESRQFGDIVQADFEDSYENLTIQVLMGLKWVKAYCPNAKFILKVDDDTFVHVFNLMTYLKHVMVDNRGIVIGKGCFKGTVYRPGFHWALSMETYPMTYYPPYVVGTAYVISGNIVTALYETAEYMPYIFIEDAFITGILRVIIGAPMLHNPEFASHLDPTPSNCFFQNNVAIASTNIEPALAEDIWNTLYKKDVPSCRDKRGPGKAFDGEAPYLFD